MNGPKMGEKEKEKLRETRSSVLNDDDPSTMLALSKAMSSPPTKK